MSELSKKECEQIIIEYMQAQSKFRALTAKFESKKQAFYAAMERYFRSNNIDEIEVDYDCINGGSIKVKRIQNTTVKFNADMLDKTLQRDVKSQVIIKQYCINDFNALTAYLKECGVDPKVFKSFISVTKSVDVKELERLEEIGKISKDQLRGCYIAKTNAPYFKVTEGKGNVE